MTETRLLRMKIQESGLKMEFIANSLGISRYTLTKKVENESDFKAGEIDAMCQLLGINDLTVKESIFFTKNVGKKSTKNDERG